MSDLLTVQPGHSQLVVEGGGVAVLVAEAARSNLQVVESQPVLGRETRVIELLTVHQQDLLVVLEGGRGLTGPQGAPGEASEVAELFDSPTPPVGASFPYLRFERDVDGDPQAIYLGTAD